MENLIGNPSDLSLVNANGWDGRKSWNSEHGCFELTATNGWRVFGWVLNGNLPSQIVFEFDYKFTNIENLSWSGVVNESSVAYGGSIYDMPPIMDKWTHVKVSISSPKSFVGIILRGVDSTGLSTTTYLRNPYIYDKNTDSNSSLKKTGTLFTGSFSSCGGGDLISIGKNIITMNDFMEF